ncbi:copper resistance CopC family protein [Micromonospora sp. DT81.3]|uniref:copper resistance CopC family protein n=1 Tax=Micromonospora sp. DT81.3 TaxID=3416523 RepID=UPI003CE86DEB
MASPIRGPLRSALAVGFAVALITAVASPAAAHDDLVSSTPTGGATVTEPPKSVSLTFSGDILDGAGGVVIEVTDAAGAVISEGDAEIDGVTVTQAVAPGLPAGDYTVTWRVVSSDGHPISSDLHFSVTEAAAGSAPGPTPSATATTTPTSTPSPSSTGDTAGGYGGEATGGGAMLPVALLTGIVIVLAVAVVAVLGLRQKRLAQDARDAARAEPDGDDV